MLKIHDNQCPENLLNYKILANKQTPKKEKKKKILARKPKNGKRETTCEFIMIH